MTVEALESEELESSVMDAMFPWHCYSNQLKQFNQYNSLWDLCEAQGIDYRDAKDAVALNNGNYGAFHIVRRIPGS